MVLYRARELIVKGVGTTDESQRLRQWLIMDDDGGRKTWFPRRVKVSPDIMV
jgi:hypothetical protein